MFQFSKKKKKLTFVSIVLSFFFRFIHKSYRLVVPAAICFLAIAICGTIYAVMLNHRLNDFCIELKQKFNNTDVPCKVFLNRFSLNDDTVLSPAKNFTLSKILPWISLVLWLIAVIVMLVRCILAADFNVQEVDCCTETTDTATASEALTIGSKVKFDDSERRYSNDKIYKDLSIPATQSK